MVGAVCVKPADWLTAGAGPGVTEFVEGASVFADGVAAGSPETSVAVAAGSSYAGATVKLADVFFEETVGDPTGRAGDETICMMRLVEASGLCGAEAGSFSGT